jgi:hypothetical protein
MTLPAVALLPALTAPAEPAAKAEAEDDVGVLPGRME